MLKDIRYYFLGILLTSLIAAGCSSSTTTTPPAVASTYLVTPIVADTVGYGTTAVDPNLKNPWGIVAVPGAVFWVANNHAAGIGVYDPVTGASSHEFAIPGTAGKNPTGIVYNSDTAAFKIGTSGRSSYIFASEDGIIWGYSPDAFNITQGVDKSTTSSFKGLALGSKNGSPVLYAANFKNASLDLFDSNFSRVGQYDDGSGIPTGFAPFNAAVLNGTLYVTYAKQKTDGSGDDESGLGNGYVDVFNPDATFQKRFASQGTLNSPWGMAIAPAGFGDQSGKLLVGNFGDGKINIFDPSSGAYLGQLKDASGNVIAIDGLWSLYVNNGTLYYTAGPSRENHGVLGKITAH